jgi:hypothetical protein
MGWIVNTISCVNMQIWPIELSDRGPRSFYIPGEQYMSTRAVMDYKWLKSLQRLCALTRRSSNDRRFYHSPPTYLSHIDWQVVEISTESRWMLMGFSGYSFNGKFPMAFNVAEEKRSRDLTEKLKLDLSIPKGLRTPTTKPWDMMRLSVLCANASDVLLE